MIEKLNKPLDFKEYIQDRMSELMESSIEEMMKGEKSDEEMKDDEIEQEDDEESE